MLLIYGNKNARIKKFTEQRQYCPHCRSFDLDIRVYRQYFHFFFVPVCPSAPKTSEIKCRSCGKLIQSDSLQREYEQKARTPFYLYSAFIILAAFISFLVVVNIQTQKEKARYVAQPLVGDVYLVMKEDSSSRIYFFLRVSQVIGDTVYTYHSNYQYDRYISKLQDEDYFVRDDELVFTKQELKEMLDKDEINAVERGYGDREGFNRIR